MDSSVVGINALMQSTTLLNPNIETDYLFSVFFFFFCLLSIYIFFWNEVKCPSFFLKNSCVGSFSDSALRFSS